MYDKELAIEILQKIYHATELILQRFEPIKNVDDFTNTPYLNNSPNPTSLSLEISSKYLQYIESPVAHLQGR